MFDFEKTNQLTNKLAFHSHWFFFYISSDNFLVFPSCRSSHQGVWEEREREGSQRQNYVRPWHKGRVNRYDTFTVFTFHSFHLFGPFPGPPLTPSLRPSTLTLLSEWQIALSSLAGKKNKKRCLLCLCTLKSKPLWMRSVQLEFCCHGNNKECIAALQHLLEANYRTCILCSFTRVYDWLGSAGSIYLLDLSMKVCWLVHHYCLITFYFNAPLKNGVSWLEKFRYFRK